MTWQVGQWRFTRLTQSPEVFLGLKLHAFSYGVTSRSPIYILICDQRKFTQTILDIAAVGRGMVLGG